MGFGRGKRIVADVAGAVGGVLGRDGGFEGGFKGVENRLIGGGSAGADIEKVVFRVIKSGDIGIDDIIDIDIIPGVAAVAEDSGDFSFQHSLGKNGDDTGFAVAVLAGAVDVGVAEGYPGEVINYSVQAEVLFGSSFGNAVKRSRFENRFVFGKGQMIFGDFAVVSAAGITINKFGQAGFFSGLQ